MISAKRDFCTKGNRRQLIKFDEMQTPSVVVAEAAVVVGYYSVDVFYRSVCDAMEVMGGDCEDRCSDVWQSVAGFFRFSLPDPPSPIPIDK